MALSSIIEHAWAPQPGPQDDLCCCPLEEVFFGGARGGGKTDGVLGKWALKEKRYGKHFNAIWFRRTTVSSEDAIERSKEIYGVLGGVYHEQKSWWRMPNGGRISFRYLESIADADEWQGRNVTDAAIDEAGQYPTPDAIFRLFGVLRSAHGVPIQLILMANPGGAGQHWIRERYELFPFPLRPKVLRRKLPDGAEHKVAVIPSRLENNKILIGRDPGYSSRLHLVGSYQLVKAWLDGDWTAVEGAFFSEWSNQQHVLAPFAIPRHWLRFRSGDWGSQSPYSIGWWAVAGDDFQLPALHGQLPELPDLRSGRSENDRTLPRGALLRYREDYGKVGGKLTANQVGARIAKIEKGDPRLTFGVLDPSAFKEDGGPSIAERINDELLKEKLIAFHEADNARVSRSDSSDRGGPMGGWDQMRSRLIGTARKDSEGMVDWSTGRPMLYTFSTCVDSIRSIPVLQHDAHRAEDLDTNAEDHCADDWRYACMSRPWIKSLPKDEALKRDAFREARDDRYDDSVATL